MSRRLSEILGRMFGAEEHPEMPPDVAGLFDDAPESLRELLGLGEKGAKGETSKVLDFSTLMNQKLGAALFGKLAAETEVEVAKSRAAAIAKAQDEHCEEHRKTQRQLQSQIEELQGELEQVRLRQSGTDRRNRQFRTLLAEIVTAVGEGKPLTVNIVADGITRVETRGFAGPTYLVFPAPSKPTAETAAAQASEPAPAAPVEATTKAQ